MITRTRMHVARRGRPTAYPRVAGACLALAGAAAGVAVRRIPGRLSVSWDVASLLPGGR